MAGKLTGSQRDLSQTSDHAECRRNALAVLIDEMTVGDDCPKFHQITGVFSLSNEDNSRYDDDQFMKGEKKKKRNREKASIRPKCL